MLNIIQIVALVQGIFVLIILFLSREKFKKVTFWLLFGSLLSIVLYIIGDDENNLFVQNADWFLFDSSLFVTFLFLFFRYYQNGNEKFNIKDLFFFIPNLIYFFLEGIEVFYKYDIVRVEIFEFIIELIFIAYLGYIAYFSLKSQSKNWLPYFAIPIAFLFMLSSINEILVISGLPEIKFLKAQNYNSYTLLIIAFMFYFISFGLIQSKIQILPIKQKKPYKNSSLNSNMVNSYKIELVRLMEDKKMYKNNKLTISDVAKEMGIPRQYVSEILNNHLEVSFQDFVNKYRVDEFVDRLKNDQNNHLTLFGIAREVGFNSKSSFNSNFKKFKGLTPTQYMKSL